MSQRQQAYARSLSLLCIETASSRAKKTEKFASDGGYLRKPSRQDLERRPRTNCRNGSCSKALRRRAPSALSDAYSIGDSALGDASGTKHSRRRLHALEEKPKQPRSLMREAATMSEPLEETTDMAAIVLTVLLRMNRPRSTVRDLFDIVVDLNRKRQKKRNDARWTTSHVNLLRRRITYSVPHMKHLMEHYSRLSFASLLHYVQQRAFLVAFPLILLHLASQFPSILATILTVTRGRWGHAFLTGDVYFLNSFLRCLFFFRPLFPGF